MGEFSVQVQRLALEDISPEVLCCLEGLYRQSFHKSRMYERLLQDIEESPPIFRLFVASRANRPNEVIGARVIESKRHSSIDYRGFPPIHGKRFSVLPAYRGTGVGRCLVADGKRYCFSDLGASVIFGESNELGALSMHGREGALYHLESIENVSRRNGPKENVTFFKEFLANPAFRTYRFPVGEGVQFVYCKDSETTALFERDGYISHSALLGSS